MAYYDWPPKCDCCGRFIAAAAPGVSWSQSWSYDMSGCPDLHDPTYRCSPCTDINGIKPTNCNETSGSKYNGRTPAQDQGEAASAANKGANSI